MIHGERGAPPLGPPPHAAFRARLLEEAGRLHEGGQAEAAASLVRSVEEWWAEQGDWDARLIELLRLHHDINNALVGVSGNAQLLMRDPLALKPGVRERLDVMVREAGRIHAAAGRLRELKAALQGGTGDARAA